MVNSYYKCASGGRIVTVWPAMTGESGFFDTITSDFGDTGEPRSSLRVTAYEAASIVLTELGTPVRTTIVSVEGMIRSWRTELDSQVVEPVG